MQKILSQKILNSLSHDMTRIGVIKILVFLSALPCPLLCFPSRLWWLSECGVWLCQEYVFTAAHRRGDRPVLCGCTNFHRSVRTPCFYCYQLKTQNKEKKDTFFTLSSLLFFLRSAVADGASESPEAPGKDLLRSAAHYAEEPHGWRCSG